MNSLQRRVQARAVGSPGPIGITTPSSSFTALAGSGAVLPTPFVECLPAGRFPAQQSALYFSLIPPSATSQSKRMPVLLSREVKQQLADFEDMSAKQTPFPNMQPVTGASGGAMRRPWLRIPTKLVSLLPCHKSILFSISLVYLVFSAQLLREKRSTSQRPYEV